MMTCHEYLEHSQITYSRAVMDILKRRETKTITMFPILHWIVIIISIMITLVHIFLKKESFAFTKKSAITTQ